jgi:hypothetical protein
MFERVSVALGLTFGLLAISSTLALAAGTPAADDGPATLTITVRTCPAGYDPRAEGVDYALDCEEPAGDTSFALALAGSDAAGPSASTGTSGDAPQETTVAFSELTAGRYTVTATAPADIESAFIGSCTSTTRDFGDYPFVPFASVGDDGIVVLSFEPGETLACDWYQVAG